MEREHGGPPDTVGPSLHLAPKCAFRFLRCYHRSAGWIDATSDPPLLRCANLISGKNRRGGAKLPPLRSHRRGGRVANTRQCDTPASHDRTRVGADKTEPGETTCEPTMRSTIVPARR